GWRIHSRGGLQLDDLRHERVAPPRNGRDIAVFVSVVSEFFAESGDALGEIVLLDDRLSPDGPEEVFPGDHPPPGGDEGDERVEGPGSQRNRAAVSQQRPPLRVEAKGPEAENLPSLQPDHLSFHKISSLFSYGFKTFRLPER